MSYLAIILRKRYFVLLLVLGGLLFMFISCSDEIGEEPLAPAEEEGLTLDISVLKPEVVIPTRSRGTDPLQAALSDVNLVFYDDPNNINEKNIYYFNKFSVQQSKPENQIVASSFNDRNISIHIGKDIYTSLKNHNCLVIGNYGEKLTAARLNKENNIQEEPGKETITLEKIQSIKQHSYVDNSQTQEDGFPRGAYFYGDAAVDLDDPSHTCGKTKQIKLKTPQAKVTIVVNGTGLQEHVTIQIQEVGLKNVAKHCYIGKDNNYDDEINNTYPKNIVSHFSEQGMFLYPTLLGEAAIVTRNHSVGTHEATNQTLENLFELYLYETKHNRNFGTTIIEANQKEKRPVRAKSAAVADIESASKDCPYVYVKGYYSYLPGGKLDNAIFGNVTFKLFLGEDVYSNFDVERNTHYKVTLNLKGFAIKEDGKVNAQGELIPNSDNSWRIDTDNIGQAGIEEGNSIQFNGTGLYQFLKINSQNEVYWEIKGDSYETYLWVYNPKHGSWQSIAETVSGTTEEKGIWIYCQPYVAKWDGSMENYDFYTKEPFARDINITFSVYEYKNGNKGKLISEETFKGTQYKPFAIKLTAEEAKRLTYNPNNPNETLQGEHLMLVDRIENDPTPWGFDTHELIKNQSTGLLNTYELVTNPVHSAFAIRYLPFGQKNKGSAMIESVQFHDKDLYSFYGAPTIGNPDTFFNQTGKLPNMDVNQWGYNYYWTLPSIEEWQIIEKRILNGSLKGTLKESPILPFVKYWTSDAVVKGVKAIKNDPTSISGTIASFAYQTGRELHSLKAEEVGGQEYPYDLRLDRTTALPFRLISLVKIGQ